MSSPLDGLLVAVARSEVIRRVWSGVYGPQFPEEHAPLGFVTRDELARLADAVRATDGDTVVDVGCGAGGPGVAVAAATGRTLVGIDPSLAALTLASAYAQTAGVAARFATGEFSQLPLDTSSATAIISIDALQLARDKPKALAEVARVLVGGGVFAFTTWQDHPSTQLQAPTVNHANVEYAARLAVAGFDIEEMLESTDAVERQLEVYAAVIAAASDLREELGAAADILIDEAQSEPSRLRDRRTRRVVVVARRRRPSPSRHS